MEAQIQKEFQHTILAIFKNKGTVASIAEKSKNNYDVKIKVSGNLYYFAVWHAFKQIDRKHIFKIDEKTSKWTDYKALEVEYFDLIISDLGKLMGNLRNLNGHYLHTFEEIKEEKISPKIIQFLKESFRLAVVQSFINEKINKKRETDNQIGTPLTKEQKEEIVKDCLKKEGDILHFLKTMFYQGLFANKKKTENDSGRQVREEERIKFIEDQCNTLDKAIDFILFVEAKKDVEWKLSGDNDDLASAHEHKPTTSLKITKGRYLSFHAMLFLFSMFLYKNEANALIPRISGFKKNGTPEDQRKLDVFLFYAKKFRSQDINCEDKPLVFFRDILQYIGKFPLGWNKALEGEETETLKKFKEAIYRREIERQFPDLRDNHDFKQFAFEYFFEKKHGKEKHIFRDLIEKAADIIKVYQDISAKNLSADSYTNVSNYDYFIAQYLIDEFYADDIELKDCCNRDIPVKSFDRHKPEFNKNNNLAKLKNRISHNLIIQSYARNHDRFLEFGIRYLAENDYFGTDAQFKMYKYYFPHEQQEVYEKLDGKTKDKLKFKGGKEVEYKTYADSRKKYSDWDTPFVVENNAVFVKLQKDERPFAIQRDLMIYFLEDALFSKKELKGCGLKIRSYFKELDREKATAIDVLKQRNIIVKEEKAGFKKILPRRLLNNYLAAEQNDPNRENSLRHILNHAEAQERRYEHLREKAIYLDRLQEEHPVKTNIERSREALFDHKNKGKNFKLTFIRKACHIMYFKDIYLQKSAHEGHHKSFHITRDEYNDFCRWMYIFDTAPYYKTCLTDLFKRKGFFENDEFYTIFETSGSLNEIYEKVKQKYRNWLEVNEHTVKKGKYDLDSYDKLLNRGVRYINVWHFKQFWAEKGYLKKENDKFVYSSLKNNEYLFPEYYIKKPVDKTQMKLWNDLQKARHEDCLLYELAMRYFDKEHFVKQRTPVQTMLNTELRFEQEYEESGQTKTYTVSVPVKNVDRWIEIQKFNKAQKLLKRLPAYLKNRCSKDLGDASKFKENKEIAFSDISKVNNHIINNQAKFTCCVMALERFYIWKGNLTIDTNKGYLEIKDIKELADYPGLKGLRNSAFHFDLPMDKTYQAAFKGIEQRFAQEIGKDWTVETLPQAYREVLEVFIDKMRSDIFNNSKNRQQKGKIDVGKIRQKALQSYLAEMKRSVFSTPC